MTGDVTVAVVAAVVIVTAWAINVRRIANLHRRIGELEDQVADVHAVHDVFGTAGDTPAGETSPRRRRGHLGLVTVVPALWVAGQVARHPVRAAAAVGLVAAAMTVPTRSAPDGPLALPPVHTPTTTEAPEPEEAPIASRTPTTVPSTTAPPSTSPPVTAPPTTTPPATVPPTTTPPETAPPSTSAPTTAPPTTAAPSPPTTEAPALIDLSLCADLDLLRLLGLELCRAD